MCTHDNAIEKRQIVNPPQCAPFTMRCMECECGMIFATTKQRRKNRKNYGQAYRKYHNEMIATHGIYY